MEIKEFLENEYALAVLIDSKEKYDLLKKYDTFGRSYEGLKDCYFVNEGYFIHKDKFSYFDHHEIVEDLYEKNENLYTFRFNEERKSVTLYKGGQKVQFIKCHEEDKFSWKIGLGVAFYKELFGKGTAGVPASIKYVEGILNWKMFYTYVLAYALDFDEHKLERLDKRVKSAKLYKEIKIND